MGGGLSRFSVKNFLSHSPENLCNRTLLCFRIFRYRKILDKKGGVGGGVTRFSVGDPLSHSAEKVRRGNL